MIHASGPARRNIDTLWYLTDRSSRRMGCALAEAAIRRGARVLLVTGPTALKPPSAAEVTAVESASQMRDAVLRLLPEASVVIKAAAVSDYTISNPPDQKIKRTGPMTLELSPATDILAEIARRKASQIVIGFAAETQDVLEN